MRDAAHMEIILLNDVRGCTIYHAGKSWACREIQGSVNQLARSSRGAHLSRKTCDGGDCRMMATGYRTTKSVEEEFLRPLDNRIGDSRKLYQGGPLHQTLNPSVWNGVQR